MTDVTDDITNAIAAIAAPAAQLVWNPDPAATDSTIWRKRLPDGARGIAITIVPQSDDPSQPLGRVMIQIKARGAKNSPNDPDRMLNSCFAVLHGLQGVAAGSCSLIQLNRGVRVPMGDDATGAWELIDQYYSDVAYPATTLRPLGGSW